MRAPRCSSRPRGSGTTSASSPTGRSGFRIHGVTGPDEYTTVVNNNAYTNVMARDNLRYAARVVELLRAGTADAYERLCRRVELDPDEVERWNARRRQDVRARTTSELGINPQDDVFLDREVVGLRDTPTDKFPLLLHYHPLVIYRHQVIKQADVVLAMFLRGDQFTLEQKRRNFDYYDPLTTGDSSLSACIQAIVAGRDRLRRAAARLLPRGAVRRPRRHARQHARRRPHRVGRRRWGTIAFGFAGMYDSGTSLRFTPQLPSGWEGITFRLQRHGSRMVVDLDRTGCTVTVIDGNPVPIEDGPRGAVVHIDVGESHRIPRMPAGADGAMVCALPRRPVAAR